MPRHHDGRLQPTTQRPAQPSSRNPKSARPSDQRDNDEQAKEVTKRVLKVPRRHQARKETRAGNAGSKHTLKDVFNRLYAEYKNTSVYEDEPLSQADVYGINRDIRGELYDLRTFKQGDLTFTDLRRRYPNQLFSIRRAVEKRWEILQMCVAQWGVEWAIQRVMQRDRTPQNKKSSSKHVRHMDSKGVQASPRGNNRKKQHEVDDDDDSDSVTEAAKLKSNRLCDSSARRPVRGGLEDSDSERDCQEPDEERRESEGEISESESDEVVKRRKKHKLSDEGEKKRSMANTKLQKRLNHRSDGRERNFHRRRSLDGNERKSSGIPLAKKRKRTSAASVLRDVREDYDSDNSISMSPIVGLKHSRKRLRQLPSEGEESCEI